MNTPKPNARIASIAGAAIVLVIILAGFLVSIPVTSFATVPSTTVVSATQQTTAIGSVLNIEETSLAPHSYTASLRAQLRVGTDVEVTWNSDDSTGSGRSVEVFVFDSTQLKQYFQNGTTSPNIVSKAGRLGTLGFHVSVADTYTLVIHNPNSGWPVIWVNVSGTETYLTKTTTYTIQTSVSATTKSCSYQLWNWLFGARSCR